MGSRPLDVVVVAKTTRAVEDKLESGQVVATLREGAREGILTSAPTTCTKDVTENKMKMSTCRAFF